MIRRLVIAAVALFTAVPAAQAGPGVQGQWVFYEKVYQGEVIPEGPSATLRMHFSFSPSGESHLWWWHEGEGDHCSRKGRYVAENGILRDEITWVDPANTPDCSDDLDMQLGRKTATPFYFRGADLALRFQLDNDSLDLIWKHTTEGDE